MRRFGLILRKPAEIEAEHHEHHQRADVASSYISHVAVIEPRHIRQRAHLKSFSRGSALKAARSNAINTGGDSHAARTPLAST
jgi:hypothetical protein